MIRPPPISTRTATLLPHSPLCRSCSLPDSIRFASAVFVATVAGMLGGLEPLTQALDLAGFAIGRHHISALDVVSTTLVAAALFAVVRLTIRMVNRSNQQASTHDPL